MSVNKPLFYLLLSMLAAAAFKAPAASSADGDKLTAPGFEQIAQSDEQEPKPEEDDDEDELGEDDC